jgi:hypothetical protein
MKLEKQLAELESLHLEAIRCGDEELSKEIAKEGLEIEKAIDEKAEFDLRDFESDLDSSFNIC